jgi:sugar lactone lactonase YvrE
MYLIFIAFVITLTGCVASGPANQAAIKNVKVQLAFPPPPDEPRYYFERSLFSDLDIVPEDDTSALRRSLTGEQKRGEGPNKPYDVAVQHGRVYVGDTVQRVVMLFDIPAQKFSKIGVEEDDNGNGKLRQPLGLDIDKSGNLYVLDGKLKAVMIYSPEGKFLRSVGDGTMLYKPAGLAVTPDGSRIYAVDIGGSSSNEHKIVVINGITGERLPDIGKRGSEPGEFNLPRDVMIAPDGSIYVVDGGNFRVQKFDKNEKYLSTFGAIGRQPGQFSRPKGGAVDPSGNVYVVDAAFGNFQIFNSEGQTLMSIGNRSSKNGPAMYSLPAGIAVDDDGRVYVVDQFFHRVDVFRPVGLPEDGGWIGKFNPKKSTLGTNAASPVKPELVPEKKSATDSTQESTLSKDTAVELGK